MMEQNRQAASSGTAAGHGAGNFTPQPRKVRRVGTISLGILLVVAGVLMVAAIFRPELDLMQFIRFSPVILIVLGVEVLVYAARPDVTLKYDVLGMILCFLLVALSAGGWALASVAERWNPAGAYAAQRLETQLAQQAYETLSGKTDIRDLSVSVDLWQFVGRNDADRVTLQPQDRAEAYVTLDGSYADANAFAAACRSVMDAAREADLPFNVYKFDTWLDNGTLPDGSCSYTLNVEGPWQQNRSADQLAEDVSMEYWYDGVCFDSQRELEEYLGQFDMAQDGLWPATAESADGTVSDPA